MNRPGFPGDFDLRWESWSDVNGETKPPSPGYIELFVRQDRRGHSGFGEFLGPSRAPIVTPHQRVARRLLVKPPQRVSTRTPPS
jgi:hypothetical protein